MNTELASTPGAVAGPSGEAGSDATLCPRTRALWRRGDSLGMAHCWDYARNTRLPAEPVKCHLCGGVKDA